MSYICYNQKEWDSWTNKHVLPMLALSSPGQRGNHTKGEHTLSNQKGQRVYHTKREHILSSQKGQRVYDTKREQQGRYFHK